MLIFCVVDEGSRPMIRVRARMRLGKGAIENTVPWVFTSRQSCVVLMSLLALGSSVGMGINTSRIDLCGHPSTAVETTLAPVCHLCIDVALLFDLTQIYTQLLARDFCGHFFLSMSGQDKK